MDRVYRIINRKRNGLELEPDDIDFLVQGFTGKRIPDYQMSAWLMAVVLQGMTVEETGRLTQSMVKSGSTLDLSQFKNRSVDKHSSGGIGDKTSLVVAPIAAACGAKVVKMSGRGLGHTGGTLDKLESIPGFKTDLKPSRMIAQAKRTGLVIAGTTSDIVPADKSIYALRDVTATVSSLPLIASSIMSKKIAGGAKNIILDVKVGSGAFMKDIKDAEDLARLMVAIGKRMKRRVVAVISDMNQPLGFAVGNALEVEEAINTLKGSGPPDLTGLSYNLASHLLTATGLSRDIKAVRKKIEDSITTGKALESFEQMIKAQKGDNRIVDDPSLLPHAKLTVSYQAKTGGYIAAINGESIGEALVELGGGRKVKEDVIDASAGFTFKKKMGERVKKGESFIKIHGKSRAKMEKVKEVLDDAITIKRKTVKLPPLVYKIIK